MIDKNNKINIVKEMQDNLRNNNKDKRQTIINIKNRRLNVKK